MRDSGDTGNSRQCEIRGVFRIKRARAGQAYGRKEIFCFVCALSAQLKTTSRYITHYYCHTWVVSCVHLIIGHGTFVEILILVLHDFTRSLDHHQWLGREK